MKRRDFIKGIIGASAVIALAKTVEAEPVEVASLVYPPPQDHPLPDGMKWRTDDLCPNDCIYVMDSKIFAYRPATGESWRVK